MLSREEFVEVVQGIVDDDEVAIVEWMGDDGGTGTIRVYSNPDSQGQADLIIVEEDEEISYFASTTSVYDQGLAALNCFPIQVLQEDDVDTNGLEDIDEISEDYWGETGDIPTIELHEWTCSVCSRSFYIDSNEEANPVGCPFCLAQSIANKSDED